MGKNRSMQAKIDKARRESMLESKRVSIGEFILNRNYDAKYANVQHSADTVESFNAAVQDYEHKLGHETACDAWDF